MRQRPLTLVRTTLSAVLVLTALGCTSPARSAPSEAAVRQGKAILRRAIEAHGADRLARARVGFTFRGNRFEMTRDGGRFRYARGPAGREDVLDNDGYTVWRGGRRVSASGGSGVNSVVYFASLPYGLEDPAVRAHAVGTQTVKGRTFDVVEVRFVEAGGGADHDDVFRYWVDAKTGRLAYLAYLFHTGGGGVRFRVATESVEAGGVVFLQWDNYGVDGDPSSPALSALPDLWVKGGLPKLSEIRIEDVRLSAP